MLRGSMSLVLINAPLSISMERGMERGVRRLVSGLARLLFSATAAGRHCGRDCRGVVRGIWIRRVGAGARSVGDRGLAFDDDFDHQLRAFRVAVRQTAEVPSDDAGLI